MNRKILILIILASLLVGSVQAYQASVDEIKNTGYPGNKLRYEITFENDKSYSDIVRFNMFNWEPDAGTWSAQLDPGEEETINLNLTIPENMQSGTTILFLYTWSQKTNETEKIPIKARVKERKKEKKINISIRAVDWSKKIDPRSKFTVKATIESRSRKIRNMKVRYAVLNDTKEVLVKSTEGDILPMRNVTVKFQANFPPKTKPVGFSQRLDLFINQTQLEKREEILEIKGYKDVEVKKATNKSLLKETTKYSIFNNGTTKAQKTITEDISSLEKAFLSTEEGEIEEGKLYFDIEVGPGETKTVSYKVNYSLLLVVPFVIVGIGYAVYYFTRKAEIEKRLIKKRTEEKFEAKIEVIFRNLTGRELTGVKIKDKLPSFINKVGAFGTLSPEVKGDGNKKLIWNVGRVKPNEERVLSYKVKSKMGIVGKVVFPPARMSYEYKGKKGEVSSNKLSMSSRPSVEEEEE